MVCERFVSTLFLTYLPFSHTCKAAIRVHEKYVLGASTVELKLVVNLKAPSNCHLLTQSLQGKCLYEVQQLLAVIQLSL